MPKIDFYYSVMDEGKIYFIKLSECIYEKSVCLKKLDSQKNITWVGR